MIFAYFEQDFTEKTFTDTMLDCLKVISKYVKKHCSPRVHAVYDKEVLRHVRRLLGSTIAEKSEDEESVIPVFKLVQRALIVLYIRAVSTNLTDDAGNRY